MKYLSKEEVLANLQKENPYKVEVLKVIHITTRKGDGSTKNPVRFVEHYYSNEDGQLLFETE